MVKNALVSAATILLALAFWLLQECSFLIPYRRLIFEKYGVYVGVFAALLFVNVFAVAYFLARKLFLKDTGRKLAHLERQLRTGETLSEELTRRLSE